MATHDLFLGGARTETRYPPRMFPQREVPAGDTAGIDDRSSNVMFSPTRVFAWCGSDYQAKFGCGEGNFSDGLSDYLEDNVIADNDIVNAVILPQMMSIRELWFIVLEPIPGVTIDVKIRDLNVPIGTIDLGIRNDGLLVLPAPRYIPLGKDDMLQFEFNGPVTNALLDCSVFKLSPLITRYCTKFN